MDQLFREQLIDRYKNPHHRGTLDPHDITFEDDNPLCGDHIRIDLRVDENEVITEATFDGQGCSISQASADLLVEHAVGKPLSEIKQFAKEDVIELLGIELGPVRLKCALLSLKVLKAGAYGLKSGDASEELIS